MKKKKNMGIRILCALIFLGICGSVMFGIYSLSAENGAQSNARSQIVTEKIKEQVSTKLETTPEGLALSERIQYFVILHSPYGSDWNANIRKLAHFSIYFVLATGIYITLTILGVPKFWRFLFTILLCFGFAFTDEMHQRFTGRTSSMNDVYLDTFGAVVSTCFWTFIAIIGSGIRKLVNMAYDE